LAQSLTKQIEEFKKKLTDEISKEVFSEMDTRWHTKAEINQTIRKRLRQEYQRQAINQMVEIIDLEANFMRAPLNLVLDMVKKHVS
jgi:predicted DNA-binding ArsR family transcriptional regulator